MALPTFTMRQLLEAGVHFGHHTRRWNPKMAPVHLRRAQRRAYHRSRADRAAAATGAGGRARRRRPAAAACCSSAPSARRATRSPMPPSAAASIYVNHRWLGGMLTNWKTISNSIKRLKNVDEQLSQGQSGPHQEGVAEPHARARQARAGARRHQGDGRPARHPVHHRHQQGGHRGRRGQQAAASRWWP